MKWLLIISLACWSLHAAHAEDHLDRLQRIANELSGDFSGKQQVGYTTVLFKAGQEGNKFPSYWAGKWGDGNLTVRAEFDPFDEALRVSGDGHIIFDVTHPAAYQGLEELIPLQALVSDIRNKPLRIRLEAFSKWTLDDEAMNDPKKKRRKDSGYHTIAECTAVVIFNGKEVPFPGQTIRFNHSNKSPVMRLRTNLKLSGAQLGLPTSQKGEVTLSINVVSPPAKVLEEQSKSGGSSILDF